MLSLSTVLTVGDALRVVRWFCAVLAIAPKYCTVQVRFLLPMVR